MVSDYLDKLVHNLARRPEQTTRIPLRTLLRRFGYRRRQPEAVGFIKGALNARGLAVELPAGRSTGLDEPVLIRPISGSRPRALPDAARPRPRWMPRPRLVMGNDDQASDLVVGPSVAERAIAATVEIRCGDGSGAGVIIHPDGLVLTARHVVHDRGVTCRDVAVRLADGKHVRGSVFRSHWPVDLALLWLDRDGPFAFLPLGDPRALRVAQALIAIGHPSEFRNTVTTGVVSNPRARFGGIEYLQTDTAIDNGNSGGPLLNSSGEVVAISVWQEGHVDSGKFAVPVDYFVGEIKDAIALGRKACLRAHYCLACGHLEVRNPRWYCPVCGSQLRAHEAGRRSADARRSPRSRVPRRRR